MQRFKSKPNLTMISSSLQNLPELTMSDIDTNTRKLASYPTGKTILFFHMPDCGWCKKFKPTFEQVVKHFSSDKSIHFVLVDITSPEGSQIQNYFNSLSHPKFLVKTVPKLIGFNNGSFHSVYAQNNPKTFRTLPEVIMYVEGVGVAQVEEDKAAAS